MEDTKSVNKHYTPHKLRSRPLRCIALPAICTLIFIAYWLICCPLIYVMVWNDYNNYYTKTWPKWWTFAFWGVALVVFSIIMLLIVLIWRCMKQKEKAEEIMARKTEYDNLLTPRNSTVKELYHVSLITEKYDNSKEHLNVSTNSLNKPAEDNKRNIIINNLNNRLSQIDEKNKNNSEKLKMDDPPKFVKCSIKKKPDLNLDVTRPLSQVSTTSLPRSPLTPRDLFFIDLIQAANSSPATFIPPTESFLDNEKKNYVPDYLPEDTKNNIPVKVVNNTQHDSESEFFIANVPEKESLTAEVFLFVDGGQADKEYKVTMFNDDVFTD